MNIYMKQEVSFFSHNQTWVCSCFTVLQEVKYKVINTSTLKGLSFKINTCTVLCQKGFIKTNVSLLTDNHNLNLCSMTNKL